MNTSVSGVIPTRDCPDMLREAMESARTRTLVPSEITVVDDGRQGTAAAVAGEFGDAVSPVRLFTPGLSAAGNRESELAEDKELPMRMGQAGRRLIEKRFRRQTTVPCYLEIHDRVEETYRRRS